MRSRIRSLARPDRLVLISPMIGITAFARFAGLAGLPAILPTFAKAAWLGILPEFNPFKYNSFPVNGARQSYRLTQALQQQIRPLGARDRLARLPPVLTFQSVIDFTVSTRAIISSLYAHLPANGSELVLFDVNRSAKLGPLLRSASDAVLTRLLPPPPRRFRTVIVTNASDGSSEVVERVIEAGAETEQERPLGLSYPARRLLAVRTSPCRFRQSDRPLRLRSGSGRGFRHHARHDRGARRARRADRQPGYAAAHVVQPVLPVAARADRGRHRGGSADGGGAEGKAVTTDARDDLPPLDDAQSSRRTSRSRARPPGRRTSKPVSPHRHRR